MKWTVQVRRAAITMRHYIHFNSDVFSTLGRAVPTPSANARSDPTTVAALSYSERTPAQRGGNDGRRR